MESKLSDFGLPAPKKTALHFIYGPTGNASLDFDQWDWTMEQVLEILRKGLHELLCKGEDGQHIWSKTTSGCSAH